MLSRPAVASSLTVQSSAFGSTSVSGPGQNACGEPRRVGVELREPRAAAISVTCAISGLKAGRPLAS